jgi:hypothetical protein
MLEYFGPSVPTQKINAELEYRRDMDGTHAAFYRGCFGDSVYDSPYVIRISSSQRGFEDWQYSVKWNTDYTDFVIDTDYRCFSLK